VDARPLAAGDRFELTVSRDELILLNNALNEVCNGLEVPEFSTRIGAPLAEVEALLDAIGDLIDGR
jgi:hypothetical protein